MLFLLVDSLWWFVWLLGQVEEWVSRLASPGTSGSDGTQIYLPTLVRAEYITTTYFLAESPFLYMPNGYTVHCFKINLNFHWKPGLSWLERMQGLLIDFESTAYLAQKTWIFRCICSRAKDLYRREGKCRRCWLPHYLFYWCKSSYSSTRPAANHPIRQLVLV